MQTKKTHKIKVNALFHRLQINKNIKFQTRILWKRRTPITTQIKTRDKLVLLTTNMATRSSTKISLSNSILSMTKHEVVTKIKMYLSFYPDRSRCSH